jgi:hypothetical protein
MTQMLDISVLAGDGATSVLSGKQRGMQARIDFKLDDLDARDEDVTVRLSEVVEAITPSFVLGMFGKSVRLCGSVDSFFDKYKFNTKPYIIAQLRRGAEYSLVKGTPLPF